MGPVCGVEDDADIHHDVDEATLWCHEGPQVLPVLIEPQTHRPASLDHPRLERFIPCPVKPSLPCWPEDKPQVVDTCIVLALFDEQRIVLGSLTPVLIVAASGEDPHHAAEESFAPVRPCLTTVLPLAIFGIEREIIRVITDQRPHLRLSELERLGGPLLERRCRIEKRHRGPPFRTRPTWAVIAR